MPRHITEFKVYNLFSAFDHTIEFKTESGVTIITAPNGYGKTAILRLINAFFARDFGTLIEIKYDKLEYRFDDDVIIHVIQSRKGQKIKIRIVRVPENDKYKEFTYEAGELGVRPYPSHVIEHAVPFIERISENEWFDSSRGRAVTAHEIDNLYGHIIERELGRYGGAYDRTKRPTAPEWLLSVTNSIDCRFIETQRLLDFSQRSRRGRESKNVFRTLSVVEAQALELSTAIQNKLAEFTNNSQEKDRTFPHRVIERSTVRYRRSATLLRRIQELEQQRSRLIDVGILDSSEGYIPISVDSVSPTVLSVLDVYVEDNMAKLAVFDSLYEKVSVFLRIINEKFGTHRVDNARKKVRCHKDKGFIVESGGKNIIEPTQLSSGEQHEIVLFYDIIFKMGENTLLLIDEPELSLHVGWQKKFVPDLLKIIESNEMSVLLATHSPQIINDRRDLRISLGGQRDE